MSKQKKDLGKGLRALLKGIDNNEKPVSKKQKKKIVTESSISVVELPIEQIIANKDQPRKNFDEKELDELVQSIETYGLIQPITVRKRTDEVFEIISGERRYRASKKAGLTHVPVYVRFADDQTLLEMALVENIQRSDLNPVEIAISYSRLLEEFDITHKDLSERIGKERSTITNYVRLLKLPLSIQNALKNNSISMGHARAIAGIDKIEIQMAVFKDIVNKELSVRKAEELIRSYNPTKKSSSPKKSTTHVDAQILKIQDELSAHMGSKVVIDRSANGKGKFKIQFKNDDEFNAILENLGYF